MRQHYPTTPSSKSNSTQQRHTITQPTAALQQFTGQLPAALQQLQQFTGICSHREAPVNQDSCWEAPNMLRQGEDEFASEVRYILRPY